MVAMARAARSAQTISSLSAVRRIRNHVDARAFEFVTNVAAFDASGAANLWYYELQAPGFNFRISDINCALGLSAALQASALHQCAAFSHRPLRRGAGSSLDRSAPLKREFALAHCVAHLRRANRL